MASLIINKTMTKKYYKLPVDGYGQPNGFVEEITKEKYNELKSKNFPYLYNDYYQALNRVQD